MTTNFPTNLMQLIISMYIELKLSHIVGLDYTIWFKKMTDAHIYRCWYTTIAHTHTLFIPRCFLHALLSLRSSTTGLTPLFSKYSTNWDERVTRKVITLLVLQNLQKMWILLHSIQLHILWVWHSLPRQCHDWISRTGKIIRRFKSPCCAMI